MIICATALLAHVLAVNGMLWEGAAYAWILAAILDTILAVFFIYARYIAGRK